MSSLNKTMFIGHTGDDVAMHYFDNGNCIGRFSIAVNDSYTNKTTGEKVERTDWFTCNVRNKGAEICEKYLKKGDKVYVEGKLRTNKYTDKDGIERNGVQLEVSEFIFLGSKSVGSSAPNHAPIKPGREGSEADQYTKGTQNSQSKDVLEPEDHDDLPF